MNRGLIAVIVLVLSLMLLAGCNPPPEQGTTPPPAPGAKAKPPEGTTFTQQGDTIKIGLNVELTGDTATFGQSTQKGVDLAVEELNNGGGLLGRKVEIVAEDNKGKGTDSATVAKKLIEVDKVAALLGSVASTNSMGMAAIAEDKKIPMVTPASTNPKVTVENDKLKRYVFRTCFIDDFQGDAIAIYCKSDLKASRIAILYDNGQDYSKGVRERVAKKFTELGGVVAVEGTYTKDDQDFRAKLTQIKAKQFDVLVLPGYYTQAAQIIKQARELGITTPIIGGDGLDSDELIKIGGKDVEGVYFTNHYSVEDKDPRVQAFVAKFKAKYGQTPDAMGVLGYDAANVLFDAIKQAGTTDPEKITDAIAATKGFPGVTGDITIDQNHNAVKKLVVLQIKDGKRHMVKAILPGGAKALPAEKDKSSSTQSSRDDEVKGKTGDKKTGL